MTQNSLSPSSVDKSSPIPFSFPRTSPSDPTGISSIPRTPSPLNPNSQSRPQSPSPSPTPSRSRTPLHSLTQPDTSLLRDGLIPVSRVTSAPAAPQSSTALLPSVPSFLSFRSRSRSPSRKSSPEASYASDKEQPSTLMSSWLDHRLNSPRPWSENSKRKRTLPPQQVEGYVHTRSVRLHSRHPPTNLKSSLTRPQRVVEAVAGVLGTAAGVTHEVLFAGVDLLRFSPIPGLELLGHTLLNIWEAVDMVEVSSKLNRSLLGDL
jgi:abelson tyrosine-protein kinase 1